MDFSSKIIELEQSCITHYVDVMNTLLLQKQRIDSLET